MPLQATSGAASYDAFGGGVAAVPNYIEDVFSTWLYTGNDSTQTINNGIDLAGKGGLVWTKTRNVAQSHQLVDTVRGQASTLISNSTNAATVNSAASSVSSFSSNGYVAGVDFSDSTRTYASWTFREQPKFFDVVTWTGTGTGTRTLNHNLGSAPGFYVLKRTDSTGSWFCYHTSLGLSQYLTLENTNAATAFTNVWQTPTSTTFGFNTSSFNVNGATYVAYLFAHNAGGFGLSGTDNVISCGSFTTDAGGFVPDVNLGWEPQWVLIKQTNSANNWYLLDTMRNWSYTDTSWLAANLSNAEAAWGAPYFGSPTPTGFKGNIASGVNNGTFIYIAIRRGPMKTPTTGTSVFAPVAQTGAGTVTTNFPVDLLISTTPSQSSYRSVDDRLRGGSTTKSVQLYTNATDAETVGTGYGFGFDNNTGFKDNNYSSSFTDVYWNFRRAPGFFDEVCYTNPPSSPVDQTRAHNLGVVPTLVISKGRNQTGGWIVLLDSSILGSVRYLQLNTTGAALSGVTYTATATQYTTSFLGNFNETRVDYLFASCPGVSKCLAFTGTGTLQTINCGFTSGARFVLIKRTDSTGDWYVWDSSRGLSSSNDPYLLLNSTAAEVTSTNWVDTTSTGFQVTAASGNNVNINGASYIALAIS